MIPGNFWLPLPLENIERVFIDTFEYRLHTIKLKPAGAMVIAQIYDGSTKVFEAHGTDTEHALSEAKKWIDEQDEVVPAYDLHSVPAY